MTRKRAFCNSLPATCAGLWIICAGVTASLAAQTFPSRALRIVVPLAPGGAVDGMARLLAGPFSESLRQTVVVDNRAGGATNIGTEIVAKAPQFEKSSKLRVLGHTGATRVASIPHIPTIAEGGVPGYELVGYFALFTTGGTPPDIIARLYGETVRALAMPDIRKRITDSGARVAATTPKELEAFIAKEIDKYAKLICTATIRPE